MSCAQIGVLSLAMPPQVNLPLKCPAAKFTGERLESRVLPRVSDQIAALRERFATHLTLVRLFACNKENQNIQQKQITE